MVSEKYAAEIGMTSEEKVILKTYLDDIDDAVRSCNVTSLIASMTAADKALANLREFRQEPVLEDTETRPWRLVDFIILGLFLAAIACNTAFILWLAHIRIQLP